MPNFHKMGQGLGQNLSELDCSENFFYLVNCAKRACKNSAMGITISATSGKYSLLFVKYTMGFRALPDISYTEMNADLYTTYYIYD